MLFKNLSSSKPCIEDLNPVIIDKTLGEVVRIKFSEDVENYVFFASKDSNCPLLSEVYNLYKKNRQRIMQLVQIIENVLPWTTDTLGGGTYIPCGIAFRGGTKKSRADEPFLLQSGKYLVINEMVEIYAKILGCQAKVLRKYCQKDYDENKSIYKEGDQYRCKNK